MLKSNLSFFRLLLFGSLWGIGEGSLRNGTSGLNQTPRSSRSLTHQQGAAHGSSFASTLFLSLRCCFMSFKVICDSSLVYERRFAIVPPVSVCSRVHSIYTVQNWAVLLLRIPQKTFFKRSNFFKFYFTTW